MKDALDRAAVSTCSVRSGPPSQTLPVRNTSHAIRNRDVCRRSPCARAAHY